MSEAFPTCGDCAYDGLGFPCRTNGRLDPAKVAAAELKRSRDFERSQAEERETADIWAYDCLVEHSIAGSEFVIDVALAFLELSPTKDEIALFAAGHHENAVKESGPSVIDRIEREAERSIAFSEMLSGIWGGRHADPDVWRRVQEAVREGPWLDEDPRTPQGSAIRGGLYATRKSS